MKSMSAFLRKLILYGYVYDVDYSYLRNYNTELGHISSNLNQIAKRVNSTGNWSEIVFSRCLHSSRTYCFLLIKISFVLNLYTHKYLIMCPAQLKWYFLYAVSNCPIPDWTIPKISKICQNKKSR